MAQKHHIKYTVVAALGLALNGCSLFGLGTAEHDIAKVNANSDYHSNGTEAKLMGERVSLPASTEDSVPTAFTSHIHFQMLNDYVEQMAIELSLELVNLKLDYPIAVSSFVQLDASLNNADSLGNQLAENFITELRKVGLLVNDYKITGNILVTPSGDFAMSRDPNQLKSLQNIGYVLSGTMVKNAKGMLINARIVGLSSNVVVAATSKLIPNIMLREFQ
jgi:TolB-like protein